MGTSCWASVNKADLGVEGTVVVVAVAGAMIVNDVNGLDLRVIGFVLRQ